MQEKVDKLKGVMSYQKHEHLALADEFARSKEVRHTYMHTILWVILWVKFTHMSLVTDCQTDRHDNMHTYMHTYIQYIQHS